MSLALMVLSEVCSALTRQQLHSLLRGVMTRLLQGVMIGFVVRLLQGVMICFVVRLLQGVMICFVLQGRRLLQGVFMRTFHLVMF